MSDVEVYVGYRPMPGRVRALMRFVVPTLLWLMCAAGAAIGWSNARTWGTGEWGSEAVTVEGLLRYEPYACIETSEGPVFVVEAGKTGVRESLRQHAGRNIAATGTVLSRDGHRMLELLPGDPGIEVLGATPDAQASMDGGPATLVGEIVDYKCFLGAMKPGRGLAHKSCAALCIRSGIPPVLVTLDGAHVVLAGPSGEAWHMSAVPYVGRRVELTGDVRVTGDLRVLRVGSVRVVR